MKDHITAALARSPTHKSSDKMGDLTNSLSAFVIDNEERRTHPISLDFRVLTSRKKIYKWPLRVFAWTQEFFRIQIMLLWLSMICSLCSGKKSLSGDWIAKTPKMSVKKVISSSLRFSGPVWMIVLLIDKYVPYFTYLILSYNVNIWRNLNQTMRQKIVVVNRRFFTCTEL